ncbi:DUF488 domain-containing protein [Micromonospora sp. CPCC 205539]|uniref:DUF488 domain-containing protein n=1 Tax=Micromonospora sp. CPCC 205539 TaxID=3122408 RepID=UPI002FF18F4A
MEPAEQTPALLTVGHGPMRRAALGHLLADAGVELVVDVRRFPGSRTNPDVQRDTLARWLPEVGIAYRWEERLGGRRHQPADLPVHDEWWTVTAFRAYASYTRTPPFLAGLADVLEQAALVTTAVMCSESVWWRCHRRLIADVATLRREMLVRHLMPDGRLAPHPVAAGARLRLDGLVEWTDA